MVETWNHIAHFYLSKDDSKYDTNRFILNCSDLKRFYLQPFPSFYTTCLQSWAELQ